MKMDTSCLLPVHDSTAGSTTVECSTLDTIIVKPCNCLKLTGINLLAFGLELSSSAGFTYIPPILLKNGFTGKSLSIIMGIGPIISLVLVPIIGHWSDHCQSRYGRRRPFILVLGMMMIFSLLIIPFNYEICMYCKYLNPRIGLATGVILLDFSCQALMNPCKALIPDIYHSLEEQSLGFTAYSCMLSLGGCLGYLITSVNWTSTFIGDFFGGQEKAVFSMLSLIQCILLVINLLVAHEKPLETRKPVFLSGLNLDKNFNDFHLIKKNEYFTSNNKELSSKHPKVLNGFKCYSGINPLEANKNVLCTFINYFMPKSSFCAIKLRLKESTCSTMLQAKAILKNSFKEYFDMPPVLFRLFIACLFGWMGIMCHDSYYTDFIGQVIYKGRPQAVKESQAFNLYDDGVRMGSWGLFFHCLASALYAAFLQDKLINKYGKSRIYLFGMISFTLCLLGTITTDNIWLINVYSALSGLGSAAITTVPYALITEYYCKKEVYYNNSRHRGVGEDMAVLDSAIFLSQIMLSLFVGYVAEYAKTSTTYMFVAAICGAAACYFSQFITFTS